LYLKCAQTLADSWLTSLAVTRMAKVGLKEGSKGPLPEIH